MRKLAVALVIAAAISLTVWLWPQHPSASTASAPTISITAPPFLPSAETDPIEVPASPAPSTDGPYSSRSDAKKAWEPVVEGFAIAYPDTTAGFFGALGKFLSVFAITQIPLAVAEGVLGVLLFGFFARVARPELVRLGVLSEKEAAHV